MWSCVAITAWLRTLFSHTPESCTHTGDHSVLLTPNIAMAKSSKFHHFHKSAMLGTEPLPHGSLAVTTVPDWNRELPSWVQSGPPLGYLTYMGRSFCSSTQWCLWICDWWEKRLKSMRTLYNQSPRHSSVHNKYSWKEYKSDMRNSTWPPPSTHLSFGFITTFEKTLCF